MSNETFFKLVVNIEYNGYTSKIELTSSTIYFTKHLYSEMDTREKIDCLDFIRIMKKLSFRMLTLELFECNDSNSKKSLDSYRVISHLGGFKVAKMDLVRRIYDFDAVKMEDEKMTIKKLFTKYYDLLNDIAFINYTRLTHIF